MENNADRKKTTKQRSAPVRLETLADVAGRLDDVAGRIAGLTAMMREDGFDEAMIVNGGKMGVNSAKLLLNWINNCYAEYVNESRPQFLAKSSRGRKKAKR